jgi:hypothetical protein
MSRLGSRGITVLTSSLLLFLLGCGGSGVSTAPTPVVTPGIVTLTPATAVSMEIGNTVSFTSVAQDSTGTALSPSPLISFTSSNPSVVEMASSGLACAGKWDSTVNPQICTPGPVGTAVINAVSAGVSSAPTTVHVHQHIESVAISPVVTQTPMPSCLSKGLTQDYQVAAFNQGVDITSTVGPFSWSILNTTVATVATTATGLVTGNVRITAATPGMTSLFASVAGVTSPTVQFITCPVVSISLAIQDTNQTSFIESTGTKTIAATVFDSSNTQITPNLTWSTSDAAAFTATGTTTGSAGGVKTGSASIIATCQPPTCNIGFPTPKVIYPQNVITGTATGTTGTATAANIWIASTQCGLIDSTTQLVVNTDDCVSTVAPIDATTNTLGVGVDLPALPDSIQFSRQGTSLYLGTDSGRLGAVGLSVVTPAANTQTAPTLARVSAAPGKVLAISPDGASVIVSDTVDTPNQVFVVNGTAVAATLPITNATAASFSPNSSKAFIVAGTNLYVYSATEALKKITLSAPANDVTFLADGAFAYLAGGSSSNQLTVFKTCDNRPAVDDSNGSENISSLSSVPLFVKASPDNTKIYAFNRSGIDFINVTTTGKPTPSFPTTATATGCDAPSGIHPGGLPTVINQHPPLDGSFNFGVGTLTPTQLILHSSGSRAYILASNNSNIVVFNFDTQSTSTIQLAGNSVPIQASLSTDGKTLYVIGRDLTTKVNSVHVVDTTINADTNQIVIAEGLCHGRFGNTQTFTCQPDLVAVRP